MNQAPARSADRRVRGGVAAAIFGSLALAGSPGERCRAGMIAVGPRGTVATLAAAVRGAQPGDTITLPPGTFPAGVKLPPEVGLRGAGYDRTILDAAGAEDGIAQAGGKGAEIADLTVRGASGTGILVSDARDAAIRRVRVSGCNDGIRLVQVTRGRVENAVVADNRSGIILCGGRDNAVVNCTLARNASLGLGIPDGTGATAFNNAIVGGATGVFVGEGARGLRLDHNLYFDLFTGEMAGQAGRRMLGDWQSSSGLDARSVRLPVEFRDPDAGDFRPAGTLAWALDRAPTSDWGVSALAGILAPKRDIEGHPRVGPPDVGAFEVRPGPPRPADGVVTVRSDQGITSAGIFNVDGVEVAYLFHDLPLAAGDYPFWFPPRTFLGQPIAPGRYDLRTVESALGWNYLGSVGDDGERSPPGRPAPAGPSYVAFDDEGRLLAGRGWSGDGAGVRGHDAANGSVLWTSRGSTPMDGLALGRDGALLVLRESNGNEELTRIDPRTGKVAPRAGLEAGRVALDVAAGAAGMAELDGRIFAAEAKADHVRFGPVGAAELAGSVDLPAPASPAADRKGGVVWVIGEGRKLVALGPDGRVAAEAAPVAAAAALAARDGVLAVASRQTGKVHLFDASDPKGLEPLRTVGRGDGPFGPYLPDRFLFQDDPASRVALALGPEGRLAVVDENRLLVFDGEGRSLWSSFGVHGNHTVASHADPRRVYDDDGRRSMHLDESSGTWEPEASFDMPVKGEFLGDFSDGGRTFGLIRTEAEGIPGSDLVVVRFDGFRARPVLGFVRDTPEGGYLVRKDSNGDGRLDAQDGGTPLAGRDGVPGPEPFFASSTIMEPDGSLILCGTGAGADHYATYWPRHGLDGSGLPVYRPADRVPLPRDGKAPLISPYTFGPESSGRFTRATRDAAGGYIANILLRSSPRQGQLLHDAGTDLAGFDAEGHLRWFRPLSDRRGLEGLATAGAVTIAGVAATGEVLALDRDGLGLGSFGPPAQVVDGGDSLDHPGALRLYRGRDGRTYALIADDSHGRHHWFRLVGQDRIKATTSTATLGAEAARALAARPAEPPRLDAFPAPPLVRIPRLGAPWPIDGDPRKWRREGIRPQVVITPETAGGRIDGPGDCSAVVRLAYHDQDLYAQFLVFDDSASFHQPIARHHQQDGVGICLNGPVRGFEFEATSTTDSGPLLLRGRSSAPKLTRPLDPGRAPRVIRVLDDARDIPERALIEGACGIDLAHSKVIITEFRLPIDETTYRDAPETLGEIAPLEPGRRFWLGLRINDNDEAGTDVQDSLVWPATYGELNPAEDGARAILE